MGLCILKVCGSRGGETEILTMKSLQKCQLLALSEKWTNVYACKSCKLIIINKCLMFGNYHYYYVSNKNGLFHTS